jgi:hypothetical protein
MESADHIRNMQFVKPAPSPGYSAMLKAASDAWKQHADDLEAWLRKMQKHLGLTDEEFAERYTLEQYPEEVTLNSYYLSDPDEIKFTYRRQYRLRRNPDEHRPDEGQDR